MSRRIPVIVLLGVLAFAVACTNKKVNNPLANVGSKQPDKVLFDRAMDAMKHNRFDVARITLQTLINTYPDSEYIARAKLAVADSWYAEGGGAALAQAEIEYKDFETFFPNMPEAAEAQLKIANIHYQQMEKPDRDYTHAMRAEEEYRQLILQYPDNKKLVAEGKQRLLEVQEVIAEREFRVGRFYYLRQSYPAAIARLRSLVDKYPLYSQSRRGAVSAGPILRRRDRDAAVAARRVNERPWLYPKAAGHDCRVHQECGGRLLAHPDALSADGPDDGCQGAAGGSASAGTAADQGGAGAKQGGRRQPPRNRHGVQGDGQLPEASRRGAGLARWASPRWWIPQW